MGETDIPATNLRTRLLVSGLAGLAGGGLLAAGCVWAVESETIPVLLPFPAVGLLLGLAFGAVSLIEIPMMVYAMRRLLVERPDNQGVVLGVNGIFVLFAFIYGIPVILFTGSVGWGLALCSLGFVRFIISLKYVHPEAEESPAVHEE